MIFLSCLLLFLGNNSNAIEPGDNDYDSFLAWIFLVPPGIPFSFRFAQWGLTITHLIISIGWERVVDWYAARRELNDRGKLRLFTA
jgi:hypothetical protein